MRYIDSKKLEEILTLCLGGRGQFYIGNIQICTSNQRFLFKDFREELIKKDQLLLQIGDNEFVSLSEKKPKIISNVFFKKKLDYYPVYPSMKQRDPNFISEGECFVDEFSLSLVSLNENMEFPVRLDEILFFMSSGDSVDKKNFVKKMGSIDQV